MGVILIAVDQSKGLFNNLYANITSPNINSNVIPLAVKMVALCVGIAGVLFLIQVAIELGKRFTGASSAGYSFLPKYAVMALGLTLYVPLMTIVDYGMSIPSIAMKSLGASSAKELHEARTSLYNSPPPKPNETYLDAATNELKATSNVVASVTSAFDPMTWSKMLLNGIIQFVAEIIDAVVFLIRQYLLNVMFVCGPIALAFSFIHSMESSFMSWFKYYIVIHLWATIAFVLDNIYTAITIANLKESSQWFNDGLPSFDTLVYQVGFIILHCMIPKLADMLISGSQGGAFFSAAAGFASKGVAMASKAVAGVASGGASTIATGAASAAKSGGSSLTGTK